MNQLTKRAIECHKCESRLNYLIAAACGITLGVMLALAI